jgi:protein-disulfide isomerase
MCILSSTLGKAKDPQTSFIPWDRIGNIQPSDFREDFVSQVEKVLEELHSYGRCQESIAACLRKDPPHSIAQRLAKGIFSLMIQNNQMEQIKKWIETRKKMAYPDQIIQFKLDGLDALGKEDAPIVVVEFTDFQCPFCATISPALEDIILNSKGKARLYLKQFPLKIHKQAILAAKACVAADAFGTFWKYCGKLFVHRSELSEQKILELAEQTGMDPGKFKGEMEKEKVLNRVADEKMEGLKYRIESTPAIFINGKKLLLEPTKELLSDRIEEEMDILQGKD